MLIKDSYKQYEVILEREIQLRATGRTYALLEALKLYYERNNKKGILVIDRFNGMYLEQLAKTEGYFDCVYLEELNNFLMGREPTLVLYDHTILLSVASTVRELNYNMKSIKDFINAQ